jgi:hypothetical protein
MRSKIVRARTNVSFIDTRSATKNHDLDMTRDKVERVRTSLLAILVDELHDLGSESHTRSI